MLSDHDYQPCARKSSLKGLLKAFKGKGELQALLQELRKTQTQLLQLQPVLKQAVYALPVRYLPLVLCSNPARSGVSYLRWRNLDNNRSGSAALEEILTRPDTSPALRKALLAIERQRQVLNMQLAVVTFMRRRIGQLTDAGLDFSLK
ncbi:TPA: DUF3158 family protein [Salmonella enterica subsp. enterica serovar Ball]|nr:DUF3158 family protein [Salmonella enterica subsp. enterica serovar Ball]